MYTIFIMRSKEGSSHKENVIFSSVVVYNVHSSIVQGAVKNKQFASFLLTNSVKFLLRFFRRDGQQTSGSSTLGGRPQSGATLSLSGLFSTASSRCTSCYFWVSHRLSRVAFYHVHHKMDSGYFILEEAKDLLTALVLTKYVVRSPMTAIA